MNDLKNFWNKLKLQAQENPIMAIAVTTAFLATSAKLLGVMVEIRNSRAWAKEVSRRMMKDAMRK